MGLSLNISEVDNSLDPELALEVAKYFRLKDSQARRIIDEVKEAVSRWPAVAKDLGIPHDEQRMMRAAFRAVEG